MERAAFRTAGESPGYISGPLDVARCLPNTCPSTHTWTRTHFTTRGTPVVRKTRLTLMYLSLHICFSSLSEPRLYLSSWHGFLEPFHSGSGKITQLHRFTKFIKQQNIRSLCPMDLARMCLQNRFSPDVLGSVCTHTHPPRVHPAKSGACLLRLQGPPKADEGFEVSGSETQPHIVHTCTHYVHTPPAGTQAAPQTEEPLPLSSERQPPGCL